MDALHNRKITRSGSILTVTEQEEIRLVQASQQGNQAAFALLLQRHQRHVFNFVLHLLHDYDEANDVTQEVFLAAWRGLPAFRNEARFSTWLYRIAYNASIQQVERQKREQGTKTALLTDLSLEDAANSQWAEEAVARDEVQAMVREQLVRLPAPYRVVLILRYFHDRNYEEMAEILSLPIGTIKTHLFRARNLLKEHLLTRPEGNAQGNSA